MRASRAKQVVGLILGIVAIGAIASALIIAGQSVTAAGTGADPATALSEPQVVPEDLGDLVAWESANVDLAREVEPTTRVLVEAAWVSAWQEVDFIHRDGEAGAEARFMPGLADRVGEAASSTRPMAVVQHGHSLSTTFYSLDGSVMTLDISSDIERMFGEGPSLRSADRFEVVMLLSDGKWRVLRLTRVDSLPL